MPAQCAFTRGVEFKVSTENAKSNDDNLVSDRERCLSTARQYITRDRSNAYGSAEDNFQDIADSWSAAGFAHVRRDGGTRPITASDVAVMMILMKLARLKVNPSHEDSWVDVAGYAACGMQVANYSAKNFEVDEVQVETVRDNDGHIVREIVLPKEYNETFAKAHEKTRYIADCGRRAIHDAHVEAPGAGRGPIQCDGVPRMQ